MCAGCGEEIQLLAFRGGATFRCDSCVTDLDTAANEVTATCPYCWSATAIDTETHIGRVRCSGCERRFRLDWAALGFNSRAARKWLDSLPDDDLITIALWNSYGFHADEARAWVDAMIFHPADARDALSMGVDANDMRSLLNREMHDELRDEWVEAGIEERIALEWIAAGIMDPSDAREWDDVGLSPSSAKAWVASGIPPDEAAEWAASEFTPEGAVALETQYTTAHEAALARQLGRDAAGQLVLKGTARPVVVGNSFHCSSADHGGCADLRSCRCTCHCWHDGRAFDRDQLGPFSGTNPPHFFLGTERSRQCREASHGLCSASRRCRCHCHCWHIRL